MTLLQPELAAEVVTASQANAEEAAGALDRALDGQFSLSVGESTTFDSTAPPDGWDGAGLVLLLKCDGVGLAVVLPEKSELLPDWYSSPDPTGEDKLNTLSQELLTLLLPDSIVPDDMAAGSVANLDSALTESKVGENASLVPLDLKSGEKTGQLSLIWPLELPDKLLGSNSDGDVQSKPSGPKSYSHLPKYSRSLLKISVPVSVVLASKRENLDNVVDLSPGSIIKFDKSCDELLHLYVNNQPIAEGEAVKVGEKFGLRINSMLMPDEHFRRVMRQDSA